MAHLASSCPSGCAAIERNRARRFSRFSWRNRFLALVVVFLSWMGGVRSAEAVCTSWFASAGITFYNPPLTPAAAWFMANCYIYNSTASAYQPASSFTWTITSQSTYEKNSWFCAVGGETLVKGNPIGNTEWTFGYLPNTCQWYGYDNFYNTAPMDQLTVTGTGTQLAGQTFGITTTPPIGVGGTYNGTFVAIPGSSMTFTSTSVGPRWLLGDIPATTSRAWTNTIPTSPASSTVVSNLFPTTSSSGSFVPTYAGSVSVLSTNSGGSDVGVLPTQPYTLATKIFFANNSAAIGALYSDGAASFGTLLSSPTTGGGVGAAVDASGNVWSLASNGNSVTLFTDQGAVSTSYSGANLSGAKALAIDGNNRTWFANSNSLTAMTNAGASVFTNAVGAGNVSTPTAMSVDNAGSLWVANSGSNTVTEFIGLGAPVTVPVVAQVANVATGTLP